ncbi:BTAD domain-containing putative transcriptional regulator [Pseudarthrobacter sp. NBSH8]|uniref:AfsR/SARP family transcriptional regulator n=1 Tax=Pseudarthrobacter sp. NBSH8 TaxID=2596911 RepID=UPI0021074075|nr:BTAD domain-containing putative transcriptional regulator [Pseudarthrobacter sp. NBSH8]
MEAKHIDIIQRFGDPRFTCSKHFRPNRNQASMGDDGYGELKLDLLGSWRLRRGAVVLHVATRQQRLIAALAIRGPSLRSYLVGQLWPEYPDARALESLRVTVHLISRQVPGLMVNAGAMLSLTDHVEVDLHRIRARIRALGQAGFDGDVASSLHELRDAEVLPGWYEDWVIFEQSRLRQDRLRAFTAISRLSLARGNSEVAGAAAEAALEIEPLYEKAVGLLIAAEMRQGNPAAALSAYERYRGKLEEDMGLLPSDSVKSLIAGALDRQARAREERLPASVSWLTGEPALHHS